jgi:hypothetical protein
VFIYICGMIDTANEGDFYGWLQQSPNVKVFHQVRNFSNDSE